MRNLTYFLIAASLIAISSESFARSARSPQSPQYLQVIASVGPGNYLANARVKIKDKNGFFLGQGVTNIRGSVYFPLPRKIYGQIPVKLPITFDTTGGLVMERTTPVADAIPFKGHLSGRITVLPDSTHVIGYADLATTIATKVNSATRNYDQALLKTKTALGINKSANPMFLRYRNPAVGWVELTEAVKQAGGYDRFVLRAKGRVLKNLGVEGLRPSRQPLKSRTNQKLQAMASSSSSSGCTTYGTYGNAELTSNSVISPSTENIENIGAAAGATLLAVAGYPELSQGAEIVSGMLFTSDSPTDQEISAVEEQLTCIQEGISQLKAQFDVMQFENDVSTSATCEADLQTAWGQYTGLVAGAQPNANGTASQYPLNSTNASFVQDVESWGAFADDPACATQINNMLFGTGGGTAGAWQQYNINYQGGAPGSGAWYTQYQVQELQSFLSYWSTIIYESFILLNEFYNYNNGSYDLNGGQQENALNAAGSYNASNGISPSSTSVCAPPTTTPPVTYCAFASNVAYAYPPSLFSDEIGMYNNGIAVNAFPGYSDGLTGDSSQYIAVNWLIENYATVSGGYPASKVTGTTYNKYNGLGINPQGLTSGVENYLNPQALRTIQLTSSQMSSLSNNGPENPFATSSVGSPWTAASFFLTAINGVSGSPWANYSTSDVSFYANDSVTTFSNNDNSADHSSYTETVDLGSFINNHKQNYSCGTKDQSVSCSSYNPNYSMGVLLGRTWWPGASTATTYSPPSPPTP